MNKRRLMISFSLIAFIYFSLIPAVFDLSRQKAFKIGREEYSEQLMYFQNNHDALLRDGPALNESIATIHARVSQLNDAMSRKNSGNSISFVPRWYEHPADHYYSIQKYSDRKSVV